MTRRSARPGLRRRAGHGGHGGATFDCQARLLALPCLIGRSTFAARRAVTGAFAAT